MAGDDLSLIETNESPEPSYDVSTDKIHDPSLDGGKGGKREPSIHETVRAAVLKQKADRDPNERFRQQAEKNGHKLEDVHRRVQEFDNISDPVEKLRWVNRLTGMDNQTAAQLLYGGHTVASSAEEANKPAMQAAIQEFKHNHPDKLTASLEPAVIKLLESNDKRLNGCVSFYEMLDRAHALAWHAAQEKNPAYKILKQLGDRDQAREEGRSRKIQKKLATI